MSTNINSQAYFLREQTVGSDGNKVDRRGVPPVAYIMLQWDDEGNTARGIAICAEVDNWSRKIGASKARAQAARALGRKVNDHPIGLPVKGIVRNAALRFMNAWRERFGDGALPQYKSTYNPHLTSFEKQIISEAKDRMAEVELKAAAKARALVEGVPFDEKAWTEARHPARPAEV